jgi:hypothetical protein
MVIAFNAISSRSYSSVKNASDVRVTAYLSAMSQLQRRAIAAEQYSLRKSESLLKH